VNTGKSRSIVTLMYGTKFKTKVTCSKSSARNVHKCCKNTPKCTVFTLNFISIFLVRGTAPSPGFSLSGKGYTPHTPSQALMAFVDLPLLDQCKIASYVLDLLSTIHRALPSPLSPSSTASFLQSIELFLHLHHHLLPLRSYNPSSSSFTFITTF